MARYICVATRNTSNKKHKHYVPFDFWEPMLAKRSTFREIMSRCLAAGVHFPVHTVAYKLLCNVLWVLLHTLLCNVHKLHYNNTIVFMYTNSFLRYCCLLGLYLLFLKCTNCFEMYCGLYCTYNVHKLPYNLPSTQTL